MGIFIKNDEQIALMRQASKIVSQTHELIEKNVRPGVTTLELNQIAEEFIRGKGATPSFLGYRGFPASICVSVNEEVIHGIPGLRRLKSGDIVSIDIGVTFRRFHGDAARTYPVGAVRDEHLGLIEVTRQCFFEAMKYAIAGRHLHELSAAVQDYAESHGCSVVKDWCGHGIGRQLHEDPSVPHTRQKKRGPRLVSGMTLAIEPMINLGTYEVSQLEDTWTIVTKDGKYSAHYENTVLITSDSPEILTL